MPLLCGPVTFAVHESRPTQAAFRVAAGVRRAMVVSQWPSQGGSAMLSEMARYILIRSDDGGGRYETVRETAIPLEAHLQDALTNHPELIPVDDLGVGELVVFGRESALASGYEDLLLVDRNGNIVIVEVKKEGNPDTRMVVAQLLDYASAIWGMSVEEFESRIVRHHLTKTGRGSMAVGDFVAAAFGWNESAGDEEIVVSANALLAEFRIALERNLSEGEFLLVVAAPEIPEDVERALHFMNAKGLRFFGVEVSYFKGNAECFVPRVVVKPEPRQATRRAVAAGVWDEARLLAHLRDLRGDEVADAAFSLISWAHEKQFDLWFGTGAVVGTCYFGVRKGEPDYFRPFSLNTNGLIEVQLAEAQKQLPLTFSPQEVRQEFSDRLFEGTGVTLGNIDRYPQFDLKKILAPEQLAGFRAVIEWALEQDRRSAAGD